VAREHEPHGAAFLRDCVAHVSGLRTSLAGCQALQVRGVELRLGDVQRAITTRRDAGHQERAHEDQITSATSSRAQALPPGALRAVAVGFTGSGRKKTSGGCS
jgi:hypothetical protein